MKSTSKPAILYVDDEPINTELFKIIFEQKLDVHIAHCASEGLEKLKNNSALKVVISDLNMPDTNGIEFLKQVSFLNSTIIRIILSGYEEGEQIQKAKENNIIMDYLPKPFDRKKLEKILYSYLQLEE